jgi:hypothetical protein
MHHHCPALSDLSSLLSPPGPLAPSLVVAASEIGLQAVWAACALITRPPCITIVLPFLTFAPFFHPLDLSHRPWLWQRVRLVCTLFGLLVRLSLVFHASLLSCPSLLLLLPFTPWTSRTVLGCGSV